MPLKLPLPVQTQRTAADVLRERLGDGRDAPAVAKLLRAAEHSAERVRKALFSMLDDVAVTDANEEETA
jgi:hypothetical protein